VFVFDDDEGLGVPILEPFLYLLFFWNRSKKKRAHFGAFFFAKGVPILEPFLNLLFLGIDLKKNVPILEPFFCKRRAHFGAFFLPKGINS